MASKTERGGTRTFAFLIGAFDALVIAVAVLAVLVLGSTLSWWLDSGATSEWLVALRSAIDIWFGMHGVALNFSATNLGSLEIPAFVFQAFPLGATLMMFGFGWRGGKRLFGSSEYWPGWSGAALAYGGLSAIFLGLAATPELSPDPVAAYFLPSIVYVGGVVAGSLFGQPPFTAVRLEPGLERELGRKWITTVGERTNWVLRSLASPALRAGTAFVFAMQAIAALVLAVLVAVNWLGVIALYEELQGGILGGLGSTLLQLAFLPNLTFFASTWLTGTGFAIGTGSSVSPLGTALGPIPTVPVFGTIPAGGESLGMVVLVIPVLVALFATLAVKKYAAEARHNFATPLSAAIAMGLSIGFVAASEMSLLALLTQAAIGPGRMQDIGADPLWVFVWIFLEVAPIAFLAAFYTAKPNAASPIPDHLKR